MTLDQILQSTSTARVDVAKVDVEGMECKVLSGGRSLFSWPRRVRLLQVEANAPKTQRCLTELASQYGYRIAKPRPIKMMGRKSDNNWFLVDQTSSPAALGEA